MKKLGIYIHIPFCKQKCFYCDFVSFADKENMQKKYIQALKNEIKNWKIYNSHKKIETIYIGGGTPSYINSNYIKEISDLLEKKDIKEFTIEINPGTVTKEKLEEYKKLQINRLSIGLQSTENILLKEIGRIHDFEEFLKT